ncbi:hypothetical protein K439DRAFT_1617479 [Ramaria rubella]|nr:hypothetical protein K439DRAFT_1617479 [Ramaria rubella]
MSFKFLPKDEWRSHSPAISNFSTPTKASNIHGTIISSHVYSPSVPVAEVDEISMLQLETFKPCCDHIRGAQMMLSWTREGEQLWMWPSHPDGQLFADYELPTVFKRYYIALPQCPCTLQETNPAKKHDYHIWVMRDGIFRGKVAAACAFKGEGCAAWSDYFFSNIFINIRTDSWKISLSLRFTHEISGNALSNVQGKAFA